jgi:hypothetical protein
MLADALDLTAVHLNRVTGELHERGLMKFRDNKVIFDDLKGIAALAAFDVGSLDLKGPLLR